MTNKKKKNEAVTEVKLEDITIQEMKVSDMEKIDKLGQGMYIIKLRDGEIKEVSLDDGESEIIDHYLNRHLEKDDASQSDDQTSVDELPVFNRDAMERNLGNWMEVEFVDPDHRGYWAVEDKISFYTNAGYTFAKPHHIKFFDSTFKDRKPGEGLNVNGRIEINGHTLLICRKETQQALQDFNYARRQKHRDQRFYMGPEEMAKAGI